MSTRKNEPLGKAGLPGVTIAWAPNPLRTIVSLDEVGRLLLWHRLKIEDLEERIATATFELEAEHRKTDREGKERTLAERAAAAVQELNLPYVLDDEEWYGKTLNARIDEQLDRYVASLAEEHVGDCTCVACSCPKCHAEGLLGIDTLGGLGKHAGHKIGLAFRSVSGGPEVPIEEALSRLRDYSPVFVAGNGWRSEEEFKRHVPRWTEEAQRAHAWLDAYRREHFAGGVQS